jgi:hypothetical protein
LWTPGSALLYTWNSDYFQISIEYNGITEPRKGSKNASKLHNKDTDWSAFTKKVKEKITEVKLHNGWKREGDV